MKQETLKVFVILLLIVVSIETIVIVFLEITLATRTIHLEVHTDSIDNSYRDPLEEAIMYESKISKFEELVKENREMINIRNDRVAEEDDISLLAACAGVPAYTNYMRVLIENGADVEEAINWHRKYGSEEAAQLIEKIDKEVNSKDK